eukprot:2136710-Pyramimonas_sp.AAC.1
MSWRGCASTCPKSSAIARQCSLAFHAHNVGSFTLRSNRGKAASLIGKWTRRAGRSGVQTYAADGAAKVPFTLNVGDSTITLPFSYDQAK